MAWHIGRSLGLGMAAVAASLAFDLHRPTNPRFIEQPWRQHDPFYRGRNWKKRNPNAAKQAAAKRARKITKRCRP